MERGRKGERIGAISITLSKEVLDKLLIFKNRSKFIDKILSHFLLDLTEQEIIELVKIVAYEGDEKASEYLFQRKCSGIGVEPEKEKEKKEKEELQHQKVMQNQEEKKEKKEKRVNINEWWG